MRRLYLGDTHPMREGDGLLSTIRYMNKLSWKLVGGRGRACWRSPAGGGAWWWTQGRAPDVSYRTGKIERGPLQATVSASGAVNPVTQVSVGTQVSGQIKELYVDFNSEVKAGQLIAMIDPGDLRVPRAPVPGRRGLGAGRGAHGAGQRGREPRRACRAPRSTWPRPARDYERKKMLVDKQFIAQSEADKARALVNSTHRKR